MSQEKRTPNRLCIPSYTPILILVLNFTHSSQQVFLLKNMDLSSVVMAKLGSTSTRGSHTTEGEASSCEAASTAASAEATAAPAMRPVQVSLCVQRAHETASLGMVLGDGCVVRKVVKGSPASVAGVIAGMRITHVNGTAVASPADAKRAGSALLDLHLTGIVDSSTRQRGRVVSWNARGYGMVAPDVPIVLPAGQVYASDDPALYVGKLFCHISQCAHALEVNASVEFNVEIAPEGLRAVGVRLCSTVPSGVNVKRAGLTRTVESIEWWNVNNLHQVGKVVVTGDRTARTLQYSRNGVARPAVRQMVFDGANAVHMPEIEKTLRVPYGPDRVRLVAALRELADRCFVQHNFPSRAAAASLTEEDNEAEQRGGRGSGAMVARTTTRLWIGWLTPTLASRPAQLRRAVEELLEGHKVESVRECPVQDKLAVIVTLAGNRGVTLMQVCELNMREHAGGVRVTIDDAGSRSTRTATQTSSTTTAAKAGADMGRVELAMTVTLPRDLTCVSASSASASAAPQKKMKMLHTRSMGVRLDSTCRIAEVTPGSAASVAGMCPSMQVEQVAGQAVSTPADVEAVLAAHHGKDKAVGVAVVASMDSSGFVGGRVESWSDRGGVLVPDVPVFVPAGVLPASPSSAVYIGDVLCAPAALPAGVRSLAPGQAVAFRVHYQGGRMRALAVRAAKEGARLQEVAEAAQRNVRAGSDMARVVNHAPKICMMHLGGKCRKLDAKVKTNQTAAAHTQGGMLPRCSGGVHVDLPGTSSPSPSSSPSVCAKASSSEADEKTESEAESLRKVLTRVSPAKLQLLQQQVAEAAKGSHSWCGGQAMQVQEAWQLKNEALEFRFRATEYNMRQATGRAPDMIEGFHGTAEANVLSIALHGFDPLRRAGQVFGAGEYFAKNPNVSVGYCHGGAYMFLCGLILGAADVDHTWVQDMGYYVMKQQGGNIQCLPRYLIRFAPEACPEARLGKALAQFGGEADDAEATLRKMGEDQRGGVEACKGRVDATMMAAHTRCLWMGWLDPELGRDDAAVEASVRTFLAGHKVVMVKPERNGARVGAFVELAAAVGQAQLAELNTRPYGARGLRISVDDAQPGNAFLAQRRCPKLCGPGKYCRGWNLNGHHDWTETCSFRHSPDMFVTHGAQLQYETLRRGTAKYDELAEEVARKGLGVVTGVRRVINTKQEQAYESRRSFQQAKNGYVAEKELWHGTACSVLDTLLEGGLQCPSDTLASDACPRSGKKGLSTTLCGTACTHCTEKHSWGMCHMFGLGIYLADDAAKSHRYVRPQGRQHSLVRCRVNLGSPYMIEGNLQEQHGLHNVVRCVDPSAHVDASPHEWDALRGHDSYYVKGLGRKAKHGYGVINNEFVVFHPAQVLPLYVVDYKC